MRISTFIFLAAILLGSHAEVQAQRSSSAVMTVTARVMKAPEKVEAKKPDSIDFSRTDAPSSFGSLTLPDREEVGYLFSYSRFVTVVTGGGSRKVYRLSTMEEKGENKATYSLVGTGEQSAGAGGEEAGRITAIIEYY